ncbi:MAG: hypothetical protein BGO55_09355 [Sphingobacteriales bacterium 50-39]|nr:fructosamine kinase family protein [Sphingobacteriales bacterium]OJW57751.1 MAG: hypothetical protein BGO55_09355 [Sphingobacteriales bacterium 50-39]
MALLEATATIRVPQVIACEVIAGKQVLILALLHQVTGRAFGLDTPNYMGALPQSNTPSPDWVEFFRDQRLQPQLKLAVDKGLMGAREIQQFQGLYKVLDSIFEKEPQPGLRP